MKIKQHTIAIIDDDEDDSGILASAFRTTYESVAVLTFNSGNDFFAFLNSAAVQPDLVITDLYMPKLSGLELITMLKADALTHNVPAILFSTIKNEPARKAVVGFANVHYLVKPTNFRGYLALTHTIMDMFRHLLVDNSPDT
ncbi:MAG TPA: response regulator [Flavobacterium sp.]|nr:response regulator [Flavobacterium sp.]